MTEQEKQQRAEYMAMMIADAEARAQRHARELTSRIESLAESAKDDVERGYTPRMVADHLAGRLEMLARTARELETEAKHAEAMRMTYEMLTGDKLVEEVTA